MNVKYIFFLIIFLNSFLYGDPKEKIISGELIGNIKSYDKNQLEDIALRQDGGYGYKYAHLALLKHLLQQINQEVFNKTKFNITVPEFFGIGSASIKNALNKNGNFDFDGEWNEAINGLKLDDQASCDNFITKITGLSNKIKSALGDEFLKKAYYKTFSEKKALPPIVKIASLLLDKEKYADVIANISKKFSNQNIPVMIRSTGNEDGSTNETGDKKSTNAGAYESYAVMQPYMSTIIKALVGVICSYVSEKSIKQRIAEKDATLFDPKLNKTIITPILIQKMIAENYIDKNNYGLNSKFTIVQFLKYLYQSFDSDYNIHDPNTQKDPIFHYLYQLEHFVETPNYCPYPFMFRPAYVRDRWTRELFYEDIYKLLLNGQFDELVNLLWIRSEKGWVFREFINKFYHQDNVGFSQEYKHIQESFNAFYNKLALEQQVDTENKHDAILRCGVMFTSDPEAGNTIGGVTVIQSTYGHNEGIVAGRVSFDTYYVGSSMNIYPTIQKKQIRLVPSDIGKFRQQKNPLSLTQESSLTAGAIYALRNLALVLEKYYGTPMDVEFVVKKDTIFIVQARPITYPGNLPKPSYIKSPNDINKQHIVRVEIIGAAGGAVKIIKGDSHIIIVESLQEALDKYINLNIKDRNDIHCIIVETPTPRTSHEATTFRGLGVPIIYTHNKEKIVQWLNEGDNTIIIDLQQGYVGKYQENITIANGLYSYPYQALSIKILDKELENNFGQNGFIADAYKKIFESNVYDSTKANEFYQQNKEQKGLLRLFINEIKKTTVEADGIVLLKYLYDSVVSRCKKLAPLGLDDDLKKRLNSILCYLIICAQDIKDTLTIKEDSPDYLKKLFAISKLEAILFQQGSLENVLNIYSLATIVLKEIREEQNLIKEHKLVNKENNIAIQYLRMNKFCINQEMSQLWTQLILLLEKANDQKIKANFNKMVGVLAELDVLPLWLNFIAYDYIKENNTKMLLSEDDNPGLVADELYQQFDKVKDPLKKIMLYAQQLKKIDISAFSDPKKFNSAWRLLTNMLKKAPEIFNTIFTHTNDKLVMLVGLTQIKLLVDTFDLAIKTMKGSTLYDVISDETNNNYLTHKNKLLNFRMMVTRFFFLLDDFFTRGKEKMGHFVDEKKDKSFLFSFFNHQKTTLKQKNGYEINKETLNKSQSFDVSVALIKLSMGFTESLVTVEDLFMTTHQLFLSLIGTLHVNFIFAKTLILGKSFQFLNDQVTSLKIGNGSAASLVGAKIESNYNNKIILLYNFPQRCHSASINLEIDLSLQEKVKILFNMYFAYEQKRCDKVKEIAEKQAIKGTVSYFKHSGGHSGVSVAWDIDINKIDDVIGNIRGIAYALMDYY
jgi:hypothetical protein